MRSLLYLFVVGSGFINATSLLCAENYAFLVGVRVYEPSELTTLRYTENDVTELASLLFRRGYRQDNIVLMTHRFGADRPLRLPTLRNIRRQLHLVLDELSDKDTILVGFSGHGVQFQGEREHFFCPMDARLKQRDTLLPLSEVYHVLKSCKAQSKVLLVDACRDDPLAEISKSAKEIKLEPVLTRKPSVPPGGIAALFSCAANQQSFEDPAEKHGVFFHYVIKGLSGAANLDRDNEIDLLELERYTIKNIRRHARTKLGKPQTPERRGSTRGLVPLVRFTFGGVNPGDVWSGNGLKTRFRWAPPGRFTMGSPKSEKYRDSGEDQVSVTFSEGFWIGESEVTQAQWRAIMRTSPWRGGRYVKEGDDYPATYVSWDDATKFCAEFTRRERVAGRLPSGWSYQLPTEAQWEYACRAGTKTAYSFDDHPSRFSDYGWWGGALGDGNAKTEPYAHEVGLKKANPWGLYDMHGNVYEWCRDWHHQKLPGGSDPDLSAASASRRVERGGSWADYARYGRSAYRGSGAPDNWGYDLGFRLALVQSR